MGVTTVAAALGTAFLPLLLVEYPMVLLASAADARNIVLVSAKMDMPVIFAIGLPRRLIGMVGSYGLGILYGEAILSWVEARLPLVGRLGRWFQKLYARHPRLMLLVWPAYATSLFAGVTRVPHKLYLPPMFIGQILFVTGAFYLGDAAGEWIDQLVGFFRTHLWESTAVFASSVAIQQLIAYRRRRRRLPEP